jgi:hypothetical protein
VRLRIGAAVAAVVVVVLLIATGLGWFGNGSSIKGTTRLLAVRTSLTPSATYFGDPVVAQVSVDVDPSVVSTSTIHPAPSFTPYVQSGPPFVQTSKAGAEETIVYSYDLQCVTNGCLPVTKPRTVQFPPVTVNATTGTRDVKATATWQPLIVSSRLQSTDLTGGAPRFRTPDSPPTAHFGVSPAVADLLVVAGVLLGIAALALVGLELRAYLARRRQSELERLSPLELALALTRDAAQRPDPADRRKALGLLADVLADTDDPSLARSVEGAAWSEDPPTPDRALELADEVQPPAEVESA